MYECIIKYPDGSEDTFQSFTLEVLMRSLDKCEIESFTIKLRQTRIADNPFKRKPYED